MTTSVLIKLFTFFACLMLPAALEEAVCSEKDDCDVNLAEPTGDLHMLQANVKKVVPRKHDHGKHSSAILQHGKQEDSQAPTPGMDGCKCIAIDLPGNVTFTVEDKTVTYPANTGSSCQAWDTGRYPGCEGDTPEDWCANKWCYVDPCKCNLTVPPKRTLAGFGYQGKPAYWSYATCGGEDTFSDSHKTCVALKEEDKCKETEGCAWNGKMCLGKELVDDCKTVDELSEDAYGKKTCRCVGMSPKNGTVSITFGNQTATYPASVGGNCSAWDDGFYPDCTGDDAPAWCKQKWCYVDACDCELPESQPKVTLTSATWQGNPVYWSYGTCGGKDVFTEDLASLPPHPPQFCAAANGTADAAAAATPAPAPAKAVNFGMDECACIGIDLVGESPVTSGDKTVQYPAGFGSSCKAWDEGLFPGCEVDSPPDWCSSAWCYVDPCKCNIAVPPKKTTQKITWQGKAAYWSYATCGSDDSFSASNPKACVNQKDEVGCKKLKGEGCAWDGDKCLGKDLVDDCAKNDELSEDRNGIKTCRCVGWEKMGYFNVTFGGQTAQYPAGLGGTCTAWDDNVYPDCKKDDKPDWCKEKWCYVDPCDCTLPNTQPKETSTTATYKGQPVFWSYATCGGTDAYTEDPSKLPEFPPKFCGAGDAPAAKSMANIQAPLASMAILALAMFSQY